MMEFSGKVRTRFKDSKAELIFMPEIPKVVMKNTVSEVMELVKHIIIDRISISRSVFVVFLDAAFLVYVI